MKTVLSHILMSAMLLPAAAPMPMHGGGQATSNYRTDQVTLTPQVDGLTVDYSDSDSTVSLTWTGTGEVVVLGYENEPFMRLNANGVERNTHSPATYLNQDRYARVTLPPNADATAAPEWEQLSTGNTARWHDHRTHWMDPTPSAEVRANPDRVTVVFPKWQIPLTVDGAPVVVSGRLLWVPPPPRTPWTLVAIGLLAALGLIVATTRKGNVTAVLGVATVATVLFTVDSLGYLVATTSTSSGRIWYVIWPVVLAGAVALAAVRTRRPHQGVISLAVAGAILAAIGGYDRLDTLTHSQIYSQLPDWYTRTSAIVCLTAGISLLAAAVVRIFAPGNPRDDGGTSAAHSPDARVG